MSGRVVVPALAGLAVGIAFILLFSLFLGPATLPPQTDYDELDGLAVLHVPPEFQPWLAPPYGVAHLWITEMAISDPSRSIKVSYDDEVWLHRAMDKKGNLAKIDPSINIGQEIRIGTVLRLDDAEKEAYFEVYKKARTNTSSFDVVFSNGLIKYYSIYFLEIT